jgi:hypothetical protein
MAAQMADKGSQLLQLSPIALICFAPVTEQLYQLLWWPLAHLAGSKSSTQTNRHRANQ